MSSQIIVVRDGLFIPRELLPVGGEWEATISGETIILRPKRNKLAARESMDKIRESLFRKYGPYDDSSVLIRQDRDER